MKKKRKGQVALEFLMTYGWAFLIILVVIGAFIYFDVLNPSSTIGGRCVMSPGLHCSAYSITTTDIQFEIRNDLNRPLTINDGETQIYGSIAGMGNVSGCTSDPGTVVGSGATAVITCDAPTPATALTGGERYQGQIIVAYTYQDSSLINRHTGTISGEVVNV